MDIADQWARLGLRDVRAIGGSGARVLHRLRGPHGEAWLAVALRPRTASGQARHALHRHHALLSALACPVLPAVRAWNDAEGLTGYLADDIGGVSLEQLLRDGPMTVADALSMGQQLASALEALHGQGQVLLSLSPAQVMWCAETRRALLADTGFARPLAEVEHGLPPGALAGCDLACMAPETVGRPGRTVDARADLYALGVLLHRAIGGQPLFDVADALGWVHAHLARVPRSLSALDARVPQVVSDIVARLLHKAPDDRYQSAWGLQADLARCVALLARGGGIEQFALGGDDFSTVPQPVGRLYGREAALQDLRAALNGLDDGRPRTVLLRGYSGIGKSALVQALQEDGQDERLLFLTGKVDQFQRSQPYAVLSAALAGASQHLMAPSDAERELVFQCAGADQLTFVRALVPAFDRRHHPEPLLLPGDLDAAQVRMRFYQAMVGVGKMLVADGRRLVLFLDDLQWADLATLELLEQWVLHEPVPRVLLIGAYRDNEVDPNHPVARMLERVAHADRAPLPIVLAPLTRDDVTAWLCDSLRSPAEQVRPLAHLVAEKTSGNPFFVRRYLDYAHQEGWLRFDRSTRVWCWSEATLREQAVMDNVVDLVVSQIGRLAEPTRRFLAVCAVAGAEFDLDEAAALGGMTSPAAWVASSDALAGGFIRACAQGTYAFNHDRIQEAALHGLDAEALRELHRRMATHLMAQLTPAEREQRLFEVMGHLMEGVDSAASEAERLDFARLALQATLRARLSNAPAEGLRYAQRAIALLAARLWAADPALAIALVGEAQAAAYLSRDMVAAERYFEVLEAHPSSPIEMVASRCSMINLMCIQSRHKEAVDLALRALAELGVTIDTREPMAAMAAALARHVHHVQTHGVDAMLNYTRRDARVDAVMRMVRAAVPPAFYTSPALAPLLGLSATNLAAEHEVAADVAYAYCMVGYAYIALKGDYVAASRAAETGVALSLQHANAMDTGEVMHFTALAAKHWTAPLADTLPLAARAFDLLQGSGGALIACHTFFPALAVYTEGGYALDEVEHQLLRPMRFAADTRNGPMARRFQCIQQYVRALRGQTRDPCSFEDAGFSEGDYLTAIASDNVTRSCHSIYQLMLAHYAGGPSVAWQRLPAAERLAGAILGLLLSVSLTFHAALLRAWALREGHSTQPEEDRRLLEAGLSRLERWAAPVPESFAHRAALVRAEILRLDGSPMQALQQYDAAIAGAQAHGFQHEAGLALRLSAEFNAALGLQGQATLLQRAAQAQFAAWGAHVLVDGGAALRSGKRADTAVERLDLDSIIKAAEAIGGELDYEALIRKLVGVAIENAGGERAMLLGPDDGRWVPLAWAEQREDGLQLATAGTAEALPAFTLPGVVLQGSFDNGDTLLLHDALADLQLALDPLVRARRIRSLVCVPLRRQQTTMGLLYVENTLASGVFAESHIRVLRVIAAQAAVTMESARLYGNLEREVDKRTQELAAKNLALQATQLALEKARDAAGEAARAKSEFLANMSHEIRTPMNAITGLARLLARAALEPLHLDYVHKIQSSSQHLLGLLNDILDFSKVEAGKVDIERVVFDLHQVLANLSTVLGDRAQDKGLALVCRVSPQVPRFLVGDPLRLGQILINYAGNAIKFTEMGEVVLDIRPEPGPPQPGASPDGQQLMLRFEVRDTGVGMSEEQVSRMFQKFSQADSSTTRRYGGTGLGLAISKSLAELIGGEVGVQSVVGRGSTFWLTARFEIAPNQHIDSSDVLYHPEQAAAREALRRHAGARLLLVEDNELNQFLATELLTSEGFVVDVVDNGALAVERVDEVPYDLVLMDMQMPVMDGLTATQTIRARPQHQRLPIIAMTANVMQDDRARCVAAGMNDQVDKPVEPDRLWAVLTRWLDWGRHASTAEALLGSEAPIADEQMPPSPEPIDWARGLRGTGGRQALYLRMLSRFCENQAGTMATVESELARDDRVAATRAVHTLRGLAGTIGATVLEQQAGLLEEGVAQGRDRHSLGPRIESTGAALAAAIAEARRHLSREAASPKPPDRP
ncbi:hypothetical protein BH11PSE8_BH11PSE8_04020 [soil metagenome]